MKNPRKFFGRAAALGVLLFVFGGCEAEVAGGGPVVYGDVGYVGPWSYPGAWYGGGDRYVHPPYGGGGGGGRPGPSIPDHPRPSGGGGGGSRGGGGVGGGSRGGGGGGGGDHKR